MPEHKCPICRKVLTRSTTLRDHLNSHLKLREFKCGTCGKAFVRNSDRKDHEKTHTKDYKFVCRGTNEHGTTWGCGAKFHRKHDLHRHMNRKDGAKCSSKEPLEQLTPEESQFVDAAVTLYDITSASALVSDRIVDRRPLEHRSLAHSAVSDPTLPAETQKASSVSRAEESSQQSASRFKPPEHLSNFIEPPQLLATLTSSLYPVDPWLQTRDYPREFTDRQPRSSSSLQASKNSAVFRCTICPRVFTRAYNLRHHLRTHDDSRPFVCQICGKAFARQHDRKRHEGSHVQERKFVCKGDLSSRPGQTWGCGRRFARADQLGRHFRSEEGRICIKPLLDEEVAARQVSDSVSGQPLQRHERSNSTSEDLPPLMGLEMDCLSGSPLFLPWMPDFLA